MVTFLCVAMSQSAQCANLNLQVWGLLGAPCFAGSCVLSPDEAKSGNYTAKLDLFQCENLMRANEGIIFAQREDFLDTNTSEVAISNEHCSY